jgi:hypothetical protein
LAYQSGNTVRIEAEFKNFTGAYIDPTVVKFIIYDQTYVKMSETALTVGNRQETGKWFYDFTLPVMSSGSKKGILYCEWYGEIDGKPSIKRETLEVSFI